MLLGFKKVLSTLTILTITFGIFSAITPSAFAETTAVTTNPATSIAVSDATLNATNNNADATGHSFWVSLTPGFDTSTPTLPAGVYSTADLGAIASTTPFSATLSSVSGLPAITPATTYYYAAWVNVNGTWTPGAIESFTTLPTPVDPTMVTVTVEKYVDGIQATASSSQSMDFPMSATWNATNLGAGSGVYTLSASGSGGNPTAYQAQTVPMTVGADYATNESTDGTVVGTACATSSTPSYALVGYTTGNTLAEAAAGTPTTTSAAFTGMTQDKYVIVWNKTCTNTGTISGTVTGGVGVLAVTSIDSVDTTATADGTYANGWKYVFNITIPSNETNVSMKFSDWLNGLNILPVAGNMRISSAQADNAGATVTVTAANAYTTPNLHMITDLDPNMPGIQVKIVAEVKIPVGTANGSYSTNYGVNTQ